MSSHFMPQPIQSAPEKNRQLPTVALFAGLLMSGCLPTEIAPSNPNQSTYTELMTQEFQQHVAVEFAHIQKDIWEQFTQEQNILPASNPSPDQLLWNGDIEAQSLQHSPLFDDEEFIASGQILVDQNTSNQQLMTAVFDVDFADVHFSLTPSYGSGRWTVQRNLDTNEELHLFDGIIQHDNEDWPVRFEANSNGNQLFSQLTGTIADTAIEWDADNWIPTHFDYSQHE